MVLLDFTLALAFMNSTIEMANAVQNSWNMTLKLLFAQNQKKNLLAKKKKENQKEYETSLDRWS